MNVSTEATSTDGTHAGSSTKQFDFGESLGGALTSRHDCCWQAASVIGPLQHRVDVLGSCLMIVP